MSKERLSRRDFLRASAITALGVTVAACAQPTPTAVPTKPAAAPTATTKPAAPAPTNTTAPAAPTAVPPTAVPTKPPEPTKPPAPKFNESPMLADLVKAGKLPPVEKRLPDEPMVCGPGVLIPTDMLTLEQGKYGGTMRFCTARTDVCAEMYDANAEPLLIAPGYLTALAATVVKPNVAKSFAVSADGKEITFSLRKGMKWSDGAPCTTADVKFWYEDILLNDKITPVPGKGYKDGNKPSGAVMKLTVVDDYTFKVTFGTPAYFVILSASAYGGNFTSWMSPSAYLKQFHQKYAKADELKKLLDAAKLPETEWWKYFQQRNETTLGWTNVKALDPDCPTLWPWHVEKLQAGLATWTRNPYYWKVDAAGNQLPYIDKQRAEIVADSQSVTMKMMAGEVDWAREYASAANLPLYKENEKKGGFKVYFMGMHVAPLQIRFNFTNKDAVWRQVAGDVRFRKALNMAINHQQVVDSVYQGFGTTPTEITGLKYDKAGAAKLLDEVMPKKDSEGWRLGPDGKRFVFPLEVPKGYTPELEKLCELLVAYWQEIGLKVDFKQVEATLYGTRQTNNETFVNLGWAHTGYWRAAPTSSDQRQDVSRLWTIWIDSAGKDATGEEPPAWAKRMWEICDLGDSFALPEAEVKKIQAEMFKIWMDNVPSILPMDNGVYPLVGSTKLGNVPTKGYAIVASFTQEQWFFKS
jgi:peptide/nickel transport system substrate-binding protein